MHRQSCWLEKHKAVRSMEKKRKMCFYQETIACSGSYHFPRCPTRAKTNKTKKAWLYLNPSSFLIQCIDEFLMAALNVAYPRRNPFLAKSIAGWTSSFQGNLPYFFQAVWKPLTSPGTPEAIGPSVLRATINNYSLAKRLVCNGGLVDGDCCEWIVPMMYCWFYGFT